MEYSPPYSLLIANKKCDIITKCNRNLTHFHDDYLSNFETQKKVLALQRHLLQNMEEISLDSNLGVAYNGSMTNFHLVTSRS